MPDYEPFLSPEVQDVVRARTKLDAKQEETYVKLLEHFSSPEYGLVSVEDGKLSEMEKFWLSEECLLRYLRASKWDLQVAITRLNDTLKWRREYGLYDKITPEHVEPEGVTGKEVIFGYDTERRPALYMLPSRQNTDASPRQLEFAVFMMERCIDLMGPGVETLDLLINYADKAKNPSFSTAKSMLNIIQSHYPERLGLALIINLPFLLNAFFKMIMPFVDPVTRNKVRFNPSVVSDELFAEDNVSKDWGGNRDIVYDHTRYWPSLVKTCEERRLKWIDKWRASGGKIGVSEIDYKLETVSPP